MGRPRNCNCHCGPLLYMLSEAFRGNNFGLYYDYVLEHTSGASDAFGISACDNSDHFYTIGTITGVSTTIGAVRKYSNTKSATGDNLLWEYQFGVNIFPRWVDIGRDGRVHVLCVDLTGSGDQCRLYTIDEDGALDWSVISTVSSGKTITPRCCAVDRDGNVAIVGSINDSGDSGSMIRYFDSTGTPVWNADDAAPSDNDQVLRCAFDSAGGLYVGRSPFNTDAAIEKFNAAGVSQWTKSPGLVRSLVTDASDRLIVCYDDSGEKIRRYSGASHATIDWTVTAEGVGDVSNEICVDAVGHVYQASGGFWRYSEIDGTLERSGSGGGSKTFCVVEPGRFPNFI